MHDRRPTPTTARLLTTLAVLASPTLALDPPASDPPAAPEEGWHDLLPAALKDGRTWLSTRYRFETVEQDGFANDAHASTIRTVLGYETGDYEGFRATIEFEDVSPIGAENFNDTVNGKTDHPVVADPDGVNVNQLFLDYTGVDDLLIRAGRQEVTLDNHRWVGNVGWRQNHQSFDAISLVYSGIENTTLLYGYVAEIRRINGEDHPLGSMDTETHLFNASYQFDGIGKATAYLYDLDVDAVPGLSSRTMGLRLAGRRGVHDDFDLLYQLEFANQSDAHSNTATSTRTTGWSRSARR